MKKYNTISLFQDEKLEVGLGESIKYTEMSPFDRAFLCGAIREKRPKKILEVGMSAGATTAVILNCMHVLDLDSKLISVDYSETWYKDSSQKTGFVAEEFKANLPERNFEHTVYLGDVVAAHLEDICKDGKIDFLILDTMHVLPGEVLDFIACFPYLTEDAVVVLHDIMISTLLPNYSEGIATKLLFDTVSGNKYYMKTNEHPNGLANIAMLQLTKDTRENMGDIFSILQMGWVYLPSDIDLQKYRSCLSENYETYFMDMFESAIGVQGRVMNENMLRKHYPKDLKVLNRYWTDAGNVLLYGCGFWGKAYYQYAKGYKLPVAGMVVSDEITVTDSMKEEFQVPIYHLSEIPYVPSECRIVLAVGAEKRELFLQNCQDKGFEIL